jgi:F-type H+-transporting ATPase subunit epsilon
MRLQLYVPGGIVYDEDGIDAVSGEAVNGSFTLLPRHVDFVTALVPGLLSARRRGRETFFAVDGGILVKEGPAVLVAAYDAVAGAPLGALHEIVERRFRDRAEAGRRTAEAFAKLEAGFIRTLMALRR